MKEIFSEIKNIKESRKELKKFGLTIGIVLLILAAFLFWNGKSSYHCLGNYRVGFNFNRVNFPGNLKTAQQNMDEPGYCARLGNDKGYFINIVLSCIISTKVYCVNFQKKIS